RHIAQSSARFQLPIESGRTPVFTSGTGEESNLWRGRQHGDGMGTSADFTRVLVVGRSPINRVVVSRIIERSGLKPISESPETAEKALQVFLPATVVLDGGADNRDCDGLLPAIAMARRLAGGSTPSVVLLSNRNGTPQ